MEPGLVAECPRCGKVLWRMLRSPLSFPIACGISGLLFYLFALVAPFLEISSYGRFQLARLETGPDNLIAQGYGGLGMLVMAVTAVFPGVKLGIMLVTFIGLETGAVPARLMIMLFRWYHRITPWSMIDVYLLGFLVAYTRLVAIAHVDLDTSLYALIGLMVSMAAADGAIDHEAVWRKLEEAETLADERFLRRHPRAARPRRSLAQQVEAHPDVIGCHTCHLVNHGDPGDYCRRCHTALHERKPDSIPRTWALVLSAGFLYIPANIYPVMNITQLAKSQNFTIFGGIKELVDYGLWPLAVLVFLASITIPLMKLATLVFLLIRTQRRRGDRLALPDARLPGDRFHRTVVDDRYLHDLDPRGARPLWPARQHQCRDRCPLLRRRRHPDDVRGDHLRSPADVGCAAGAGGDTRGRVHAVSCGAGGRTGR